MSLNFPPEFTPFSVREAVWIAVSYAIGCFTAGYYWTRWKCGQDIRKLGSGNVGARNVGRLFGAGGFTVTMLLDFAKGAIAVGLAWRLNLQPEAVVASLALSYPWLRFPLDFLRASAEDGGDVRYFGFTPGQYACLGMFGVGLFLWQRGGKATAYEAAEPQGKRKGNGQAAKAKGSA